MSYTIITALDSFYEKGLQLFIRNLELQAQLGYKLNIVILDNGLTEAQREWSLAEIAKINESTKSLYTLQFAQIDLDKLNHLDCLYNQSVATYSKLFIPEVVQESDALYIDPDMIITLSIKGMIDYCRSVKANYGMCSDQINMVLAQQCPWLEQLSSEERMLPYCNAGLIYFNLKYAREHNFTQRGLELMNDKQVELKYYDQTLINFLLRGEITNLPESFNVTRNYNLYLSTWQRNTNIHFIGGFKPWNKSKHLKHQEGIKIYREWMGLERLEPRTYNYFKEWLARLKLFITSRPKRRFKEMAKLIVPKGY